MVVNSAGEFKGKEYSWQEDGRHMREHLSPNKKYYYEVGIDESDETDNPQPVLLVLDINTDQIVNVKAFTDGDTWEERRDSAVKDMIREMPELTT